MSRRLILCKSMILAMALMSLPVSQAQTSDVDDSSIQISSYQDDPFVRDSNIKRMDGSGFELFEGGRLLLTNKQVRIREDVKIYRADPKTGDYKPFAWNPWPAPASNKKGNFKFPNEDRSPYTKRNAAPTVGPSSMRTGCRCGSRGTYT